LYALIETDFVIAVAVVAIAIHDGVELRAQIVDRLFKF
jgi:hypothetical protein